jgi:hypothetical protein
MSAYLIQEVGSQDRDASIHGGYNASLAPATTRGSQTEDRGRVVPGGRQGGRGKQGSGQCALKQKEKN